MEANLPSNRLFWHTRKKYIIIFGTTHYAEDLLQNTFLRLWKYRSSLNDEYLLEQHLFNFARSVFIDHTRSLNKLSKVEALVKQELQTAKAALSDELDREKLLLILNAMPEIRRKAFILHKLEGYSYKEVADMLSLDAKALDNHIFRAMKEIRKKMGIFSLTFF